MTQRTVLYQSKVLPLPIVAAAATVTWGWEVVAPLLTKRRVLIDFFDDDEASPLVAVAPRGAGLVVADTVARRRFLPDFFDDDEAAPIPVPFVAPRGWPSVAPERVVRAPPGKAGAVEGPIQDRIVSLTPQGYEAIYPSLRKKLAMIDFFDDDDAAPVVPSAFQGSAWITAPHKVAKAIQPQQAGALGLLPVQGYAWVVQVDVPGVRRAPRAADTALVVPTAFQGSAWVAVDFNVNKPRQIAGAGASPLPVQPVPTEFIPNAWSVMWDGPTRKRFGAELQRADQPVLSVYSSVVVTFPDGWQVTAPTLSAKRPAAPVDTGLISVPVIITSAWVSAKDNPALPRRPVSMDQPQVLVPLAFYGWVVTADSAPQPRRPTKGAEINVSVPTAQPRGFDAGFISRAAIARRVPPAETAQGRPAAAPTQAFDTGWGNPPAIKRKAAVELLWPNIKPEPVAGLGDTALWGFISHQFRTIRPPPPDFWRTYPRPGVRIISQPTLLGGSTAPTLLGASTAPALFGVSQAPSLTAVSTGAQLLGQSTDPSLLGVV